MFQRRREILFRRFESGSKRADHIIIMKSRCSRDQKIYLIYDKIFKITLLNIKPLGSSIISLQVLLTLLSDRLAALFHPQAPVAQKDLTDTPQIFDVHLQ